MQQNRANLEEEWNISGSEDEADTPSAAKAGSRSTETGKKLGNDQASRKQANFVWLPDWKVCILRGQFEMA